MTDEVPVMARVRIEAREKLGTNNSVKGTNSGTNGIKRKYPLHKSLIPPH
jgi:hypothetical protein